MRTPGILALAFVAACLSEPARAFDEATVEAAKACHDHVWFEVPEFGDLPNAAIGAYPGIVSGTEEDRIYIIYWHVRWDEPLIRAAGECTVTGGAVDAYEDYTKQ